MTGPAVLRASQIGPSAPYSERCGVCATPAAWTWVNDVGVGVIDRDEPVAVGVGGAGAQALDKGGGEHRSGRARRVGWIAFEGVLGSGRCGQHHPAASLAEKAVPKAEVGIGLVDLLARSAVGRVAGQGETGDGVAALLAGCGSWRRVTRAAGGGRSART